MARGAHQGNLYACKYPWRSYWKRRALKFEDRWVHQFVETYQDGLRSDKPGATEGELRIIEVASAARACWMLALSKNDMKIASAFMQTETRALKQLGLERRAKNITSDLQKFLEAEALPEPPVQD